MSIVVTPGAVAAIDVPLIEWPAAEELRARLAAEGRPRLLVVSPSSPPPRCLDELEVDRRWVVVAALNALADDGVVARERVGEAIARYGIDPAKPVPMEA